MHSTKSHSSFKFIWILKVADLTCRTFESCKKEEKKNNWYTNIFCVCFKHENMLESAMMVL